MLLCVVCVFVCVLILGLYGLFVFGRLCTVGAGFGEFAWFGFGGRCVCRVVCGVDPGVIAWFDGSKV